MIHNGIEYGDMQLIAEAYHLMRDGLQLSHADMHRVFSAWNKGDLQSYLIEITGDIMAVTDADGQPLVEKILDAAGQKGTGKWTGVNSLDLGIPVTLITEAVMPARCLRSKTSVSSPPRYSRDRGGSSGKKRGLLWKIFIKRFWPPKSYPTPRGLC